MAYDHLGLSPIAVLNSGRRMLAYDTADSLTTVLTAGYFNAGVSAFVRGDRIDIVAAGERALAVVAVSTSTGVVVVSSSGPGVHHIPSFWTGTLAEYQALGVNDADRTFYAIVE